MWESCVALGISPPMLFHEYVYPRNGDQEMFGNYDALIEGTEWICACLGEILHQLEEDIAAHSAATIQP